MGVEAALAVLAITAAASAGYSIYSGEQQAAAQKQANEVSMVQAKQTADKAEQANNAANQKKPNSSAILSAAMQAAQQGVGSTTLTGPQGVSNDLLSLGKTTLLGS